MKSLVITAIFLILSLNSFSQKTIIVSRDQTGNYSSIQKAIKKAKQGATIIVKKGTYVENIVMRDGIILKGENNPTIDGNGKGEVVKLGNNCTISNFTIINSGSSGGVNDCGILAENISNSIIQNNIIKENGHYGAIVRNSNVIIRHNFFINNAILGIYLDDDANFEISYNHFSNHKHSALDVSSSFISGKFYNNTIDSTESGIIYGSTSSFPLEIEIFNNIFHKCTYAINCPSNFASKLENNLFYNNQKNYWDWDKSLSIDLSESNIISNPQFIDSKNYNYGVKSTSPCIGAGIDGTDIGAVRYELK